MKTARKKLQTTFYRLLIAGSFVLMMLASAEAQTIFLGTNPATGPQCHCLDNATTLENGQFQDTITVTSMPGETWTVVAPTLNAFSITSPAPPLAPITALGETLTEIAAGTYQLIIRHVDALGFSITVDNGSTTRTIANSCFYPNVTFTGLSDTICLTSLPLTLTADAGGVAGNGLFTINGQAAVVFNPRVLGEGDYTVRYTFDAGEGTAGDSSDPACTTTITQDVVVPAQPTTAVISFVNVTLGEDCQAIITPRMMLTGNYPCLDDFIISVFDQSGINIGNVVTGLHAGQQLNVRVMSEAGQFIGDGVINITDGSPPTISCLPTTNRVDISNDIQLLSGTTNTMLTSFIPNNFSCYNPTVAPMSGLHYYTLQQINVTTTDYYTIELSHTAANGGAFGIYQGAFDPFQGPCQGMVGVGEPLPAGEGYYSATANVVRLHVMLTPDMPYTLLTTTYDGSQTGDYEYAIYSEGNGAVVGLNSITTDISLPLYCSIVSSLVDNPASIDLLGRPSIFDACMLSPTLTFVDDYIDNGHCGIGVLRRTFTVTDQSGNSAQCTQVTEFPLISLDEVNLPPKTINISCDESYATDNGGNPSPTVTGYPYVVSADGTHNVDPTYCNILSNYDDLPEVVVCSGTTSFIRRWVVFDNCNPEELFEYDQLIIIGDRTGPVIECTAADTLIYSTSSNNCMAAIQAPLPTVTDNCSGWQLQIELITEQLVPITNPFGTIIGYNTETVVLATIPHGGNRLITNVPRGVHHFRYTATDDCWNMSVIECPIKVIDTGSPTAVCDDVIHVSLGGDGRGFLSAEDVDEGSSDACSPVTLLVRRQIDFDPNTCTASPLTTTDWAPNVDLYCCEAGSSISVELQVTDQNGITNTCSSIVTIDDVTPPVCVAPAPVFTDCSEIPDGADFDDINMLQTIYGMAQVVDDCAGTGIIELNPVVQMTPCGLGSILRSFETVDAAGNASSCQQLITFTLHTDYEIKFPKDVIGECEEPGADTLVINTNGCSLIDVQVDDEFFGAALDACYKILRTYTVTNVCEYDGFSPTVEIDRNIACLANRGTQDVWVIRRNDGSAYVDIDNDETNNLPAAGTRSTVCDGNSNPDGYWMNIASTGRWSYTQMIKVIDTSVPVIDVVSPDPFCSNNIQCEGSGTINFSVSDGGCSNNPPTLEIEVDLNNTGFFTATTAVLTGSFPDYQVTGTYPIGNHRLRITVTDVCGNPGIEIVDFSVVDCLPASLICNTNVATVLLPQLPGVDADGDGEADVAAAAVNVNDFINSTGVDCTGPFRFTVHEIAALDAGADIPFPNHPALVVTCDDVGFVPVRVYLWDSAFNPYAVQPDGTVGGPNFTSCETLLNVQDPNNNCSIITAMGTVSGLIITEEGVPVSGVEVSPRNDMMEEMMMTTNDGLYSFNLETEEEYLITPYSANDYLNGVSTFDIILISKHILGVDLLNSPYKIIAADINNSGSISTLDLVHLRKAILGITAGFANSESWRFVDAEYEFPNPANPWQEAFPESRIVSNLGSNINEADFVAIKIGDVNGNVTANLLANGDDRSSNDTYYLRTDDHLYERGETVEAVFSSANENDEVQGFQFTLQFEPEILALEDIEWGQIQPEHVNLSMVERGIITVSWNDKNRSDDFTQSELSFCSIRFKALSKGRLSESIGLTSRITRAEAYGFDDSVRGVALNFMTTKVSPNEFYLEQNRPNPFGDQTIIGFQIPESGGVTLTIYDTNGKVVHQYQQHYAAGYNQILVDAQDIRARGLLYYKLETDQYAATKKMVIIE